ncbi:MAG: sigma-70 family RNA polymerase sigma factor [Phycisphaerae bacterium]
MEQSVELTTQLLQRAAAGDKDAASELLPHVYEELRARAGYMMRQERVNHTLQATAIVHEAYLRLVDQDKIDWQGRQHFVAMATTMIRRVLVDHARSKNRLKRGGDASPVQLEGDLVMDDASQAVDIIQLDELLESLADLDERQARIVELRFFGGLSVEHTAELLDVSERTVKSDWRAAKAWLRLRMDPQNDTTEDANQ